LVVDDEEVICWALSKHLASAGYRVFTAHSGAEAMSRFRLSTVDLVFLDYQLPDVDGLSLLTRMKEQESEVVVILMTGHTSVEQAVEAMKLGAFYYTRKPFNLEDMQLLAERGLETTRLRREVQSLKSAQGGGVGLDGIIGDSAVMLAMKSLLTKIAQAPSSTVLLTGESGTGKDLVAKAVHHAGPRSEAPFMNITCSALSDSLLESELFGHEKGAFTDAQARKRGLLELAAPGTVFLDEIGEMSPVLQAKLLRVLEEKTFKRVGGVEDIRVDVRIVAATHRDLRERVREGKFREDLYFRLQVLPIHVPPLRERAGDIPRLCNAFIRRFATEFRRHVRGVTPAALAILEQYRWPGNVRELKNALERAVLLAEGEMLGPQDFRLPGLDDEDRPKGFTLPVGGLDLRELERDLVVQALARTSHNHTRAAALLKMTRDQMRYRIEKFGLGVDPDQTH
jgi:two-component system response regulator AtoC